MHRRQCNALWRWPLHALSLCPLCRLRARPPRYLCLTCARWCGPTRVLSAINRTASVVVPGVASLITFGVYAVTATEPLTAARVFTALLLFNILREVRCGAVLRGSAVPLCCRWASLSALLPRFGCVGCVELRVLLPVPFATCGACCLVLRMLCSRVRASACGTARGVSGGALSVHTRLTPCPLARARGSRWRASPI